MSMIPEEIITDILIRLPARDLRRLRRVSKSWRARIDSPYFIKMHLNHSKTNSKQTLVLYNGLMISHLNVEDIFDYSSKPKLNRPLEISPHLEGFGSCNGLLLLGKRNVSYHNHYVNDFGIWNPNTGEYKSLTNPPYYNDYSSIGPDCHAYGFGFDSSGDDYKVIKLSSIFGLDESKNHCKADIYSLRSNSWRQIKYLSLSLIPSSFKQFGGAFASGALHWAGTSSPAKDWVIFAFDIETEDFHIVAKPDILLKGEVISVEEFNGKLCLTSCRECSFIDIWIMREYGVKESWMKLLSLSSTIRTNTLPFTWVRDLYAPFTRPLAYFSHGNKILLNKRNGKLIWYDLDTDTEEEIRIRQLFAAYSCVDSLVQLSAYELPNHKIGTTKRMTIET